MVDLVLLVVAAAWAAVLIPPFLRARVENRPNSSVTDFRRKLNRLERAVPARANGPVRSMARPLAQSPMTRPAAPGRPGQPSQLRRQGRGGVATPEREPMQRRRVHGDPTGGTRRPAQSAPQPRRSAERVRTIGSSADDARRRRGTVFFSLVTITLASLFLAGTTKESMFVYIFVLAFLATAGFGYLMAQAKRRETAGWTDDWMMR